MPQNKHRQCLVLLLVNLRTRYAVRARNKGSREIFTGLYPTPGSTSDRSIKSTRSCAKTMIFGEIFDLTLEVLYGYLNGRGKSYLLSLIHI